MNEPGIDREFEALLQFIQQQRGFDFTGYKRESLMRRVTRRMQTLGIEGFSAYTDYLQVDPDEYGLLFNTILINVTSFFRDPPAWEVVAKRVLPAIAAGKASDEPLRVWSAGCASGQEAYSAAMLIAETLGVDTLRDRVKLYATDVDEEALAQARSATYSAKEMESLEPDLRERYFERVNGRHAFRADLRRSLIFGRHDLVQDAPISRLDLLLCRNTLMYFNSEAQAKIFARFHFALNGDGRGNGFLFLGRAEMLSAHGGLFQPVDLKCRVFAKIPEPGQRERAQAPAQAANDTGAIMDRNERLRAQALEEVPVPRILIDVDGTLTHANQRARTLFTINPKDIGRPLSDLEISYRPIELRALIEQAYAERRMITQTSVERRFADNDVQYLDVLVAPLLDDGQRPLGASVSFVDVSRYTRLQDELRSAREEVQTTNEELQSSNEELETTNEELQSSNEELETTNEELQSTNEELETMNEELQSTNEELQTVNEELRQSTDDLNRTNAFLEAILTGLRGGAIVVDAQMNVTAWNSRSEDLWGLRADEVRGQSLLNLDIGLPLEPLRGAIRACLSGDKAQAEIELDATNRRGKKIHCRVTASPLLSSGRSVGVILLTDELV